MFSLVAQLSHTIFFSIYTIMFYLPLRTLAFHLILKYYVNYRKLWLFVYLFSVYVDTTVGGHGLLIPECTLDLVVHASELTILNFNSPLIIFDIIQEPKHKLPAMLTLDVYSYNSDSSNQKKK